MNKMTIIILLLLAVTFIPIPNIDNRKIISITDPYRNEGFIAFVVNESPAKPLDDKPAPAPSDCDCGGTGVLTHGDGHKTVCPCKASGECKCGKKEDQIKRKVVLFFTSNDCGPCLAFKKKLPDLAKLNMPSSSISDDKETRMEIVDIDENPELYDKYKGDRKSIPLFLFLDENGKEVAHFIGNQDLGVITRKWNEY